MKDKLYMLASDISIPNREPNDIYVIIEMRMCSTRPNGNKQGVTEAFIDSIIGNPDKYNCLPLYVDIDRLRGRVYRNLGHMFDKHTGTFGTTMIGSMIHFSKVQDEYGISLMGEARIPKRDSDICKRIIELYEMNMQNFSYEITYSKNDVVIIDGVTFVDASENNNLTGMCVVSVPAYEESVAKNLIAENECENERNDTNDHDKYDDDIDDEDDDDDDIQTQGADYTMTLEEAMSAIAEKDSKIAELEAKISAAEKCAQDMEKEKDEAVEQAACDKNKAKAELDEAKSAIAEKDVKISELEAKVAELEPMKAELETIKAEKEAAQLAEKQEKAKSFAERQGLDVESEAVKTAIASQDYEAIASMAMEIKPNTNQKVTMASYAMTAGLEIEEKYGDLVKIC